MPREMKEQEQFIEKIHVLFNMVVRALTAFTLRNRTNQDVMEKHAEFLAFEEFGRSQEFGELYLLWAIVERNMEFDKYSNLKTLQRKLMNRIAPENVEVLLQIFRHLVNLDSMEAIGK